MRLPTLLTLLLFLTLSLGCSTSSPTRKNYPFTHLNYSQQHSPQKKVTESAVSFLGTPYRYGGTTPKGFDCSGFVQYVYKTSINIGLPRLARDQARTGKSVSAKELRPGDIVHFKIKGQRSPHVGIYLGKGNFIHAPSSGGRVNIQTIHSKYWRKLYRGARRII